MPMLQIKRMPVGQIGTNCYLLEDTEAKTCAVIDPGDQPDDIDREIRKAGLKLTMILITHGHFDHVLGVPGLLQKWPGTVYVDDKEVNWKKAGDQYMLLAPVEGIHTVKEGDTIDFGGTPIQVLHTPGHSPGSVTYRVGDVLFFGDTLFAGSCGRTDFVGGSYGQILQSLKRLVSLEGNLRCALTMGTPPWTWSGPTTPSSGKPCDEPLLHRPRGKVRRGVTPPCLFPRSVAGVPKPPFLGDNELSCPLSWEDLGAPPRPPPWEGENLTRQCRVQTGQLPQDDPVVATTSPADPRAFYSTAVGLPGAEPPLGMLSGAPVKPPPSPGSRGHPRRRDIAPGPSTTSPLRRKLAVACAQASRGVQASLAPQEISLYVGIPFCPTRCAYCSFISAAGSANRLIPQYLEALLTEIDAAGAAARQAGKTVRAVYIGGGTPTTLEADQLARLLERVGTAFALAPGTECTVEAGRPDTITREKLLAIRAGGGNRISVNPQTMSDPVLAASSPQPPGSGHPSAGLCPGPGGGGAGHQHGPHRRPAGGHPPGLPPDPGGGDGPGPGEPHRHTLAGKGHSLGDTPCPPGTRWPPCWTTPGPPWRRGDTPPTTSTGRSSCPAPWKCGLTPGYVNQYNICMMEELHTVQSLGAGGVTKFVENGVVRRMANPGHPQYTCFHRHHSRGKSRLGVTGPAWLPHLFPLCDFVP